jgi:hypothetical protein
MFSNKKDNFLFSFILLLITLIYLSCSKEEKDFNEINLDKRIQTPFLISAYINSTFCKFDFCSSFQTLAQVFIIFLKEI